jgi:hypothetical protein
MQYTASCLFWQTSKNFHGYNHIWIQFDQDWVDACEEKITLIFLLLTHNLIKTENFKINLRNFGKLIS